MTRNEKFVENEHIELDVDWLSVPVDTKILVKCKSHKIWEKRHFAKYVNGTVYAWGDGKTSYTSGTSDYPIPWDCAKLAEEDV